MIPESNPIIRNDLMGICDINLDFRKIKGKTILVTGGGGLLASYLIKSLLAISQSIGLEIKIICVARSFVSVRNRLSDYLTDENIYFLEHDIAAPLPANIRADYYIHAASQASPKYYGIDPVGTLLANTSGTSQLLERAVKTKAQGFLYFSSGEVYGIPVNSEELVHETAFGYIDPMNVRSCYAESKRIGETMCTAWAHQFGLHTNVIRTFHTYGPGLALDDGRVFADFVANAVAGKDIQINSDGRAKRSFCYISDATAGFLTVLLKGEKAEAYNVGNPTCEVSILELAEIITKISPEKNMRIKIQEAEKSNLYIKSPVNRATPSIEKIGKLGWFPKVEISEGFRRTIASYQE
jgi:UDP-glucuronate decarboxylase